MTHEARRRADASNADYDHHDHHFCSALGFSSEPPDLINLAPAGPSVRNTLELKATDEEWDKYKIQPLLFKITVSELDALNAG